MTQAYRIRHRTHFTYERPVSFARCTLRLQPAPWPDQHLISHNIGVEPRGEMTTRQARSGLANVTRVVLPDQASWIDIVSECHVAVTRAVPQPMANDPDIARVGALARATSDLGELSPANFLYPSPNIPPDRPIADWAAASLDPARPVFEAAFELALRIRQDFRFDADATRAETPPAEAFAARAGVCQDFAQIMICGLRAAGLPAAYASGYIRTIPPPGEARLVGADAMHGWVLVWCGPERGWIGFDPTNGITMAEDHVLVAVGRDYLDIAPVDGIFTGHGGQSITVSVDMEPVS